MRIDLPTCNLKTCRHCFDGNCTDRKARDRCEYALTVYGKDIVPVVRCKDCEYYVETNGGIGTCELTISGAKDDGFCAWGERKDDA